MGCRTEEPRLGTEGKARVWMEEAQQAKAEARSGSEWESDVRGKVGSGIQGRDSSQLEQHRVQGCSRRYRQRGEVESGGWRDKLARGE